MKLRKYQMGGAAPEAAPVEEGSPVQGGAPAEGGAPAGGAEEQLAQVAQQLLQMLLQEIGDPNAVAAVLQMAMEMLSQASQGGGAPQEAPVFKKGGKLAKCKKACGGGGLKVK